MFRQVLNSLVKCVSSGYYIRCSPNNRLAGLLDWRIGRRSSRIESSESTSSPDTDWGLWLFHQYDLEGRPYPEA